MEPSNGNSTVKRRSLANEEDANILTFRRRNKVIAVVFIVLIISLTLVIAALIIQLRRNHNASSSHKRFGIPPILDFCSFSNAPTCLTTLNPIIITHKFITDPNQIFALSLQTAAEHIQHVINASLTDAPKFAFNNCSDSLRAGLDRVRESLATVRVNPFVESLSKEERDEMESRIVAAEEDVESCLDDLAKVESAGEMTAKLVDVQVYLISAVDFVDGYAKMGRIQMFEDIVFDRSIISENLFGICICGLQLLFMFGLFCSLFRIR